MRRETVPLTCLSCGTPLGSYHHAGCLHARCRVCGDQAMACWPDEHVALS